MNLLHLSFVGGLKPHQAPPTPPTAEERLSAFRAAYPSLHGNAYHWKWLDDADSAAHDAEKRAAALPSIDALRLSRDMLHRIADDTRKAAARIAA
jgi:hypothetical protein